MKKQAFEEAGVPLRQQQNSQQNAVSQPKPPAAPTNPNLMGKSAEVTLNMLNAPESEVDVEGIPEECQVKLEFEAATEEVAS